MAARLLEEPEDPAELTRALALYVATAWHTFQLLRPGDWRLASMKDRWSKDGLDLADDRAALGWLEAERANVLAAVEQAAATPAVPAEIAIQLAQASFGFPWVRCHWDDLAQVNRTAMRVARRIGDEGLLREAKQRRSQEATHPP